jgi:hypothetical protein
MGQIHTIINDDIERKFRTEIARRGGKRGDLAKSLEEAINLWLESKAAPKKKA